MPIGKALKDAGTSILQGVGLYQESQKIDLMQQRLNQEKELQKARDALLQKQNELESSRQDLEKQKLTFDAIGAVMGQEGIDPKRKDALVNMFKENYKTDISPFFVPNTEEKTGIIKSYSLENTETIKNKFEKETADLNRKLEYAKIAQDKLEALADPQGAATIATINSPEYQKAVKAGDWQKTSDMLAEVRRKFPAPYATQHQEPTKPMKLEIEKKLASISDQIAGLGQIEKSYVQEMLTYKGQFKRWTLQKAAKVADEKGEKWVREKIWKDPDEQFLGKAWQMRSDLGRYFDAYRLEVTKSQAAMRELDMLRQNVMNAEMASPEFKYALKQAQDRMNRQQRILRYAYNKGYTGDDYWNFVDKTIVGSEDPTLDPKYRDEYGDKLAELYRQRNPDAGIEEIERFVVDTLKSEGYLK